MHFSGHGYILHVQPYRHYGRSLFERALEGGYNFLDADFGTETCTVTCRFQEHLGYTWTSSRIRTSS